MQLTPHQQQAFDQLQKFLEDSIHQVFVLKGYAGTGKTTLVGLLADWLKKERRHTQLLATTGRAAKVLQNRTGHPAITVHSCIFAFDDISGEPEQDQSSTLQTGGQLQLNFDLRPSDIDPKDMVYIIDEASMISHEPARESHTARFGSGRLLHDLFEYADGRKVVFVGDPCQLPPIAENPFSSALNAGFLNKILGVKARETELTEIMRQRAHSEILHLASPFRESVRHEQYEQYPKVIQPKEAQASLVPNEFKLVNDYVSRIRGHQYGEAIMIGFSNWQINNLNQEIRKQLFPNTQLQPQELLLVVQNSYDVELANGDQIILEKAEPAGHKAGLSFLKVQVRALHNDEVYETLLIQDLLYNKNPGLTPEETQRLLIDFHYRMREMGIQRKTDLYRQFMRSDPYLNALRAKFGYAMTCHKAQGGEWPHVYLNIHKSIYGMPRPNLYRWYYTALTRAQQHLHINDGWWIQGFNARTPS
ncbi:MAG: AAA family ATPase [Lewinellaceae bacterium]|nr:AAA family ATPase [Lewinellaceae bacterium]